MIFSTQIKNLLQFRFIVLAILLLPLTGCSVFEDLINSDGTINLSGKLMQATGIRPYRDRSRGDRKLTAEETKRAAQAKELFSKSAGMPIASAQKSAGSRNTIIVPPGKKVKMTARGFCLDAGIAAPKSNEPLQLINVSQLVPGNILPVYKALQAWEAKHPDRHGAVQSLMWGIRHARSQSPMVRELAPFQKEILNEAYPGGANKYEKYLNKQYNKALMDDLKRQALGQLGQFVDNKVPFKLKSNLDLTSAEGLKSSAVNMVKKSGVKVSNKNISAAEVATAAGVAGIMSQLMSMPVSGTPQANTAYTLLDEGVAAYSVTPGGVEKAFIEIVNTTDKPYSFDVSDYAGFSTRKTQPVAMYPDIDGLPQAPWEEEKDCQRVTILSVTPKKCCYRVGDAISPQDFDVRTSPPGLQISVDPVKAIIPGPGALGGGVGSQSVTIRAMCSNGTMNFETVSVNVTDENYEIKKEGSFDLKKILSKIFEPIEEIFNDSRIEKKWGKKTFDFGPSLKWNYTESTKNLCCDLHPGNCQIKKIKKYGGTFSLGGEASFTFPIWAALRGSVKIGIDFSAKFLETDPTCDRTRICATGELSGSLEGGITGGLLPFGIISASASVRGSLTWPGLEFCYDPSSGFESSLQVSGEPECKADFILSADIYSFYSSNLIIPLTR